MSKENQMTLEAINKKIDGIKRQLSLEPTKKLWLELQRAIDDRSALQWESDTVARQAGKWAK